MRLIIAILWLTLTTIGFTQNDAKRHKPCTEAECLQAEREASTLRTWDALYRSTQRYYRCEDVDAMEGYSESTARILVDHWDTLPRLAQLMRNDKSMQSWIFVDATMSTKDISRIKENAIHRCPTGVTGFCAKLRKQADDANAEDKAVRKTH